MAEENNNIPPAQQPDGDLKAELEKARSSNKALKAAAAGLALLFLILAGVAFFAYRRISMTKALFEEAVQGGQRQESSPESRAIPPGLNPFAAFSSSAPVSGLGLFAGSLPEGGSEGGAGALTPEDTAKVAAVMDKYTQRPVWKELMADLKKDPETARALDVGKGGNPMAMMSTLQKSGNLNKIMMKYATRPDFLKLMMELSTDRDLKPMLKKVPAGSLPGPGALPEPAPQAADGGDERAAGDEDGPLMLDPAAISGTAAVKTRVNKAPPPVDTD